MQVAIDSCKKEYSVTADSEIKRIQNLSCMQYVRYEIDSNGKRRKYKYDFPKFMKYVREPDHTKNGHLIPYETVKLSKEKLEQRINPEFVCPMNWLVECLDKTKIKRQDRIERAIPVSDFFIKKDSNKDADKTHLSKIRTYMKEYDNNVSIVVQDNSLDVDDKMQSLIMFHEDLINKISRMKMSFITIRRIIETALGIETNVGVNKEVQNVNRKYRRKILNCIYSTNKESFLKCFTANKIN